MLASAGKVVDLAGWEKVAAQLASGAEQLRPLGMSTGYHNHQTEWKPVEGKRPMDVLAAGTPKDVVLQFDVGTCVEVGEDPIAWIKANPGRIRSVHCKDWGRVTAAATLSHSARAIRRGRRSLRRRNLSAASMHYLVEQEIAGPEGQIAMARKCMDNWKKLRA